MTKTYQARHRAKFIRAALATGTLYEPAASPSSGADRVDDLFERWEGRPVDAVSGAPAR
jgi:hypothetical protein